MTERPIIFSAPMVRAILDGRKTQTRRVMKSQPHCPSVFEAGPGHFAPAGADWGGDGWHCPYGQPCDHLWVRESFQPLWAKNAQGDWETGEGYAINYIADGDRKEWHDERNERTTDRAYPSIHMPRWASRITLEVVSVRVERLQDISSGDALAEGATMRMESGGPMESGPMWPHVYAESFAHLWDSINRKRPGCGWDSNPWVWVVEFRRVTP